MADFRCSPASGSASAILIAATLCGAVTAYSRIAEAHPHVFVKTRTTVLHENGQFTALKHAWSFDEASSIAMVEGLDTNGDGVYDRAELAERAKENVTAMAEFEYFTLVEIGAQKAGVTAPSDYYFEYKNSFLTLYLTVPFEKPIGPSADGFTFSVADPSYYVAFEFEATAPVTLADGAPKGCKADYKGAQTAELAADPTLTSGSLSDADRLAAMLLEEQPNTVEVTCTP